VTKRKNIGTKLRFEVFKRDSFTCQYCGRSAPDVILEIDHISPVSKGGDNDVMNLVTSCWGCNSGKGDRELDDDTVIAKQRAQLEELNERRLQLEMMLEWRDGVRDVEGDALKAFEDKFTEATGFTLNRGGRAAALKTLRKFGLACLLDALDVGTDKYLRYEDEDADRPTQDSVEKLLSKLGGICFVRSRPQGEQELYKIRGRLRYRFSYCPDWKCLKLLKLALEEGASIEDIREVSESAAHWTDLCNLFASEFGVGL
jgi:hypothetical protein